MKNYQGAKYLPNDLGSHVVSHAVCVAGLAATHKMSTKKPLFSERESKTRGWLPKLLIALVVMAVVTLVGAVLLICLRRCREVREHSSKSRNQ